ncbi:MAG TPA: CoA pyrophosphatase [Thermoanaerobaculia bacterium]|nr:CoA pyrophosphatase [Thermoanaerobaculia bacterium]
MPDLLFDGELRRTLEDHLSRFERRSAPAEGRLPASVAVVVLPDEQGRAAVVLTVRAAGLRRHGGQWACPGGRRDPGEAAEAAALRELEEEIGLSLSPKHVLGCLDDCPTRSGFVITPVVVWGTEEAELRPDPREVAEVHLLPVAELTPENVVLQPGTERGRPVMALSLSLGLLFAPTAAILYQFAEVAVHGRETRVDHFEQPRFAWR